MYLNRWKKRNPELVIDLHKFLQESIQRSLQGHQDDTNVLSASDLENLFNGTIDAVSTVYHTLLAAILQVPVASIPKMQHQMVFLHITVIPKMFSN